VNHWELLVSLEITKDWQFTPICDGLFFRFRYVSVQNFSHILVAQAQLDDELEFFGQQRLQVKSALDILEIPAPFFFAARRLAIRGFEIKSPRYEPPSLTLQIEVNTMPFSSDPGSQSSNAGTTTTVAASITSVSLLTANSSRKGLTVYNNSALATLYVGFGATASTTNFAVKIAPNTTWECPQDYDGPLSGIWSVANGGAQVTEFI
jgi:hypothetical protein